MLIFFFILWIILNGRVTLELILFGIGIAAAIYAFAHAMFGYGIRSETVFWRNFPLLLLYTLNLIREIVKAALYVLGRILTGKKPEPVIVEFHSGLPDEICNVFLANSITLTPGTYTIFQEKDHFKVHCLTEELSKGIAESSFVHLLRKAKISKKGR